MTVDVKRYPILVVDDEQHNLDAFRFNFRKTFDIVTATSGPEALSILAEKGVAVVVTTANDLDLRETISAAIVRHGWGLRELRPLSLTLEEIFLSQVGTTTRPL